MWNRNRKAESRRSGTNNRHRAEDRLSSAERCLVRGRLDRAVREALELAAETESRQSGRDLSRLNRIGDLLVRADQITPGVTLFERVGRAYAAEGFWAKAIAIYKKILRYDPWRSDIQTQLAFLYQRSGLPTGAGSS